MPSPLGLLKNNDRALRARSLFLRRFRARTLSFTERLFLSIIVSALKISSFLFIGGTIVPINGSGLNEMEYM